MGAKYLNMFSSRGKKYSFFFFFKAKLKCGSAIPAFDLNAGKAEGQTTAMEEWKGEQQPRLNRDWAIPKSGAVTQDDF